MIFGEKKKGKIVLRIVNGDHCIQFLCHEFPTLICNFCKRQWRFNLSGTSAQTMNKSRKYRKLSFGLSFRCSNTCHFWCRVQEHSARHSLASKNFSLLNKIMYSTLVCLQALVRQPTFDTFAQLLSVYLIWPFFHKRARSQNSNIKHHRNELKL